MNQELKGIFNSVVSNYVAFDKDEITDDERLQRHWELMKQADDLSKHSQQQLLESLVVELEEMIGDAHRSGASGETVQAIINVVNLVKALIQETKEKL